MSFMGSADLAWEYASAGKTFVMIRAWVAGEGTTVPACPTPIQGIAQPIADAITGLGGEIRLGHTVQEVLIENGRAVGVRAVGPKGEQVIRADRVIVTASWLDVEKLFKDVPPDVQRALEKPKTIHRAGAFLISLLEEPVSHLPGFVFVMDARTGDNMGGVYIQSEEQPWNSPPGKQLIWMYYLDDLGAMKKTNTDELVANKLNPMIDKVFPGFQAAPKEQKFFYAESTSHFGLSAGPKISAKSPHIENLYFAGDGTAPNYAAISDGAASTGMSVAKMILGQDKLGIL
jgi:phytoene dehydrogenase-like protein